MRCVAGKVISWAWVIVVLSPLFKRLRVFHICAPFRSGFLTGSTEHMFRAFDNRIPTVTNLKDALERIQPLNLTPRQQAIEEAGGLNRSKLTEQQDINLNLPLDEELLQSGATVHEERRKLYGHGNECYTVATTPCHTFVFTAAKGNLWASPSTRFLLDSRQQTWWIPAHCLALRPVASTSTFDWSQPHNYGDGSVGRRPLPFNGFARSNLLYILNRQAFFFLQVIDFNLRLSVPDASPA